MPRILFYITTCSLAAAFRMSPVKKGSLASGATEKEEMHEITMSSSFASMSQFKQNLTGAPRAWCGISGDPHILTFDATMKGGGHWHPIHALGHWWLVRSKDDRVKVQATYGPCAGGPITCTTGIAVGGSILQGAGPLIVQTPCDFDFAAQRCRNADNQPRITWNGQRVSSVSQNGVTLTVHGDTVRILLPENMEIVVQMWGGGRLTNGQVAPNFMNAQIFMVQGTAGEQCGHCGNYNSNFADDLVYESNGDLKAGADSFCNAAVSCGERMIPEICKPNNGGSFTLVDCPQSLRNKAEQACRAKLAKATDPAVAGKLPGGFAGDELKDCIMDGCLDMGFVDGDVAAAVTEEKTQVKAQLLVGPKAFCSVSGDPHVLTFDSQLKSGPRWHPMHAVGDYWLVKTRDNKVAIQATYSECGIKNGGGWMSAQLNGVPRTCMTAIAVGGTFLAGGPLVIKVPCDWDWENGRCRNTVDAAAGPVIRWNGATVSAVQAAGVSVTTTGSQVEVKLPQGVRIALQLGGRWRGGMASSMMDAIIEMSQNSAGAQCGHCGNFNGNKDDDELYEQTGKLKPEVSAGFAENNPPESSRSYSSVWDNNPIGIGHARSMLNSDQAWSARDNSPGQWMVLQLDAASSIDGVYIQGRKFVDQSVTSVSLEQSADCRAPYTAIDGGRRFDTSVATFDRIQFLKFPQPLTAQCVKITVWGWRNHISMRAGLSTLAPRQSGSMANVAETQRAYSSVHNNNATGTWHARSMLDSDQAWSAGGNQVGEWMVLQLDAATSVNGVYIQGRKNSDQSVTSVSFERSTDCKTYAAVEEGKAFDTRVQQGSDKSSFLAFMRPLKAKCIKIKVLGWRSHISMRAALSTVDDGLCNPDVACEDRLFGERKCQQNGEGVAFELEDCPKPIRDKSEAICKAAFAQEVDWAVANKIPKSFYDEQLKDCIMDGCLSNAFADVDAADALLEDKELLKLKGA